MRRWVALSGLCDHGLFQSDYNLGVAQVYMLLLHCTNMSVPSAVTQPCLKMLGLQSGLRIHIER